MAKKLRVSPRGVAVYPHLTVPDTKFDEDGAFHVKLRCASKDEKALALKADIDATAQSALKEAKAKEKDPKKLKKIKLCENMPYEVDDDTGDITFTFKTKASGKRKKDGKPWTRKVPMFDAKLHPIEDAEVWSGSILKVSFEMNPFGVESYSPLVGVGVSLRLEGVQILKLVQGGRDAAGLGFGEEEGFEADEAAQSAGFSTDEDAEEEEEEEESETEDDGTSADDF